MLVCWIGMVADKAWLGYSVVAPSLHNIHPNHPTPPITQRKATPPNIAKAKRTLHGPHEVLQVHALLLARRPQLLLSLVRFDIDLISCR